MKFTLKIMSVLFIAMLLSCGGGDEKKEKKQVKIGGAKTETVKKATPKKSNRGYD